MKSVTLVLKMVRYIKCITCKNTDMNITTYNSIFIVSIFKFVQIFAHSYILVKIMLEYEAKFKYPQLIKGAAPQYSRSFKS